VLENITFEQEIWNPDGEAMNSIQKIQRTLAVAGEE